uniref:Uncharacterized protein n=1 Tax=Arion vulgaris TaxID=1028688 RepID=A0A0B7AAD4_9EUPU
MMTPPIQPENGMHQRHLGTRLKPLQRKSTLHPQSYCTRMMPAPPTTPNRHQGV